MNSLDKEGTNSRKLSASQSAYSRKQRLSQQTLENPGAVNGSQTQLVKIKQKRARRPMSAPKYTTGTLKANLKGRYAQNIIGSNQEFVKNDFENDPYNLNDPTNTASHNHTLSLPTNTNVLVEDGAERTEEFDQINIEVSQQQH